jgi:hypothetical protein
MKWQCDDDYDCMIEIPTSSMKPEYVRGTHTLCLYLRGECREVLTDLQNQFHNHIT